MAHSPLSAEKKYLVFAEQFYYPEGWGGAQIPRDITMYLARSGWRVDVVCGSDLYSEVVGEAQPDPAAFGVRIRRIPRLLGGDVHKRKLVRQLWYYALAIPLVWASRAAVYVTQTNPPLILPLVALISWIRGRPMVIIAQDLYPEVLFAHGMLDPKSIGARLLRGLFRWSYRRARKVISLGPRMSARLVSKGVSPARIVEISNWATGDESIVRGAENSLRQAWGLAGKFVVLYSGNLGIAHDVTTPIAAIARVLPLIPNMVLVFIGKGSRMAEAQSLVTKLGIAHAVQFRPFVPFELLPHSLGLADLALVTLRKGFEGLVVPSKLLGHLARGVPTLYVGPDSDVEHFLRESGGGCCVANEEVQLLTDQLAHLAASRHLCEKMGAAGQRYYEHKLSKSVGLGLYQSVLSELVADRESPLQRSAR